MAIGSMNKLRVDRPREARIADRCASGACPRTIRARKTRSLHKPVAHPVVQIQEPGARSFSLSRTGSNR
jgi:hypothetical protein